MIDNGAISLGPLTIHLYGVMIGLGMLLGVQAVVRLVKERGLGVSEDEIWSGLLWGFMFGLLGARAYHVIDLWGYYSVHLGEIVALWQGGLGIFGGIVGGAVGLLIFAKRRASEFETDWRERLWLYLDLGAVGLPLGQALGRWGNFFNQELYGLPAPDWWPFTVTIDPMYRLPGYEAVAEYHALFLYESLWSLMTFGVLWWWIKRRGGRVIGKGSLVGGYLMLYGLGRFGLEWLRIEAWSLSVFGVAVRTAQLVAVVSVVVGGWLYVRGSEEMVVLYKRGRNDEEKK